MRHAGHHINPDGTVDECVIEMLDQVDEIRVHGILDRVRPLLPEAKERGCGIRLTLSSGWFQSVEVADDVPVNKIELVER